MANDRVPMHQTHRDNRAARVVVVRAGPGVRVPAGTHHRHLTKIGHNYVRLLLAGNSCGMVGVCMNRL